MNVTVLMASGDEDTWTDVAGAEVDMNLGGALLIIGSYEEAESKEDPGETELLRSVECIYAPGMWMKFEYDEAD